MGKNFGGCYLSNGEELDVSNKVSSLPLVTFFRKGKKEYKIIKIIILGPIPL